MNSLRPRLQSLPTICTNDSAPTLSIDSPQSSTTRQRRRALTESPFTKMSTPTSRCSSTDLESDLISNESDTIGRIQRAFTESPTSKTSASLPCIMDAEEDTLTNDAKLLQLRKPRSLSTTDLNHTYHSDSPTSMNYVKPGERRERRTAITFTKNPDGTLNIKNLLLPPLLHSSSFTSLTNKNTGKTTPVSSNPSSLFNAKLPAIHLDNDNIKAPPVPTEQLEKRAEIESIICSMTP